MPGPESIHGGLAGDVGMRPARPAGRLVPVERGHHAWRLIPFLAASVVALPIVTIPWLALFPEDNIWPHLADTVLGSYVAVTLALLLGVGTGTALLGVSTAWLVTSCQFPGRRLVSWGLLLPFAVPSYVIAYVYTDLLEYSGPVQAALRHGFGWSSAAEYWFPEIRGLGGAVCMLSLVLYPYVYLLSRAAFLQQSTALVDVSRSLGCGPWRSFFRVSLPVARPAIAVGLAFAMMETLNDYGTVDYFAVRTLTAGIYDVWLNMGNLGGAAQIAVVMLAFVLALLFLERASRRHQRHHQARQQSNRQSERLLRGWRAWAVCGICYLPIVAGFAVPASVLGYYALLQLRSAESERFLAPAMNSVSLSAATALLALFLGLIIGYGQRIRPSVALRAASSVCKLGYAVPGAVLAVGVIVPLSAFDNGLDALAREHLGFSTGLLLTGSVGVLLFAYVARFLAAAVGAVEASLANITPSMDDAARNLGHGPGSTFLKIHVPLIRSGALTAALIVFVDTMKELPATLVLRPFNFDTLATHVYQFASDELIEQASVGALVIVLAGLGPVILLSRSIANARTVRVKGGLIDA